MDKFEFQIDLEYYQEQEISNTLIEYSSRYRKSLLKCLNKLNRTKIETEGTVLYVPKNQTRGWCHITPTGIIEDYKVFENTLETCEQALIEMFRWCCNKGVEQGLSKIRIRCNALDYTEHIAIEKFLECSGCSVKVFRK